MLANAYHMGYSVKNLELHIVNPKKIKPTLNASCISIYSTNLRIKGIRFHHIVERKKIDLIKIAK